MKTAGCPLCGQRKGKRALPGQGREHLLAVLRHETSVEVDCPADCVYLTGAHAAAVGRARERTPTRSMRLAPHVQPLTQAQAAIFFYLVSGIVRVSAAHREADDALWREAIGALRKTFETRESGLVYDHKADDWRAQTLVKEMQALLTPPENEGRTVADTAVLRAAAAALEAALDAAIHEKAGPRAFLETAMRVAARIASDNAAEAKPAASRILEP